MFRLPDRFPRLRPPPTVRRAVAPRSAFRLASTRSLEIAAGASPCASASTVAARSFAPAMCAFSVGFWTKAVRSGRIVAVRTLR